MGIELNSMVSRHWATRHCIELCSASTQERLVHIKMCQLAQSRSYTLDPPSLNLFFLYFFLQHNKHINYYYYIITYRTQGEQTTTSTISPPCITTTHNTKIFFILKNLCIPLAWPFVKNSAPTCSPQNSCCCHHCFHLGGNISTSLRDAARC